jgi:hypothetical protein
MMCGARFVFVLLFAGATFFGVTGRSLAAPVPVAIFGFELFDDTADQRDSIRAEQDARLRLINAELVRLLVDTGQVTPVDLKPFAARIEEASPFFKCNACENEIASDAGARLEVVGVVRKVSNLILSIELQVKEVDLKGVEGGAKVVRVGVVDIRGNTDESWMRGVRYLVKNRIFAPGLPALSP